MSIEKKIRKVIYSCNTHNQLFNACQYVSNAYKAKKITYGSAREFFGEINGVLNAKKTIKT